MTVGGRLRARLALRAGLLAVISFTAMAVVLEFTLVRPRQEEADGELAGLVDRLAAVVTEKGRAGFHGTVEGSRLQGGERFTALFTAAGDLVESSGRAVPPGAETLPEGRPSTVEDPVAGSTRVLRRAVAAPGEGSLVVLAGLSMEETRTRQNEIRFLLVVAVLGGAALVAGGAAAGAGLVLDPLRALTDAARKADAERADLRMPDRGRGDEFDDLARLLNDLLARVGASMEEERRFAGEAAHELRSPLSVIRLRAEDALAEEDPAAREAALRAVLTDVDRVERLVQALLELSRSTGAPSAPNSTCDGARVLGALAEDFGTLAGARGVAFEFHAPPGPIPVAAPREILETTVSVLVDNALRYTPRGGKVSVEATAAGGRIRVKVADSGPGVGPEEAERVFDRLFRGKAGRASGAGFGLGLPLARRLARSVGGDLSLENPGEPGARFTVELPST